VSRHLFAFILVVCCLVSSAFSQTRRQAASTNRGIVLEINVVETSGSKAEEIDKIEKRDQLTRLIAERKLRVIASLQMRTRVGESFTATAGQHIPIQTATLPIYRQSEGRTPDRQDPPLSQVFQGISAGIPQIEYRSPGLTVEGNSTKAADNFLDLNLKVELSGVDRSTGSLTPSFTQLSCTGAIRVKESETAVLMNAIQQENRPRSIEEIAGGTENEPRSRVMVIITTRPVR
jgi:hypothetical protein